MKEQGSILVATLFVMMILLFLGGVFIRLITTEMEISDKFSNGIAAYYAAEAGVKRALVEVDNQTTHSDFTEVLNYSNYYVSINDGRSKQEKVISAIGKKNGAVRKAIAYVFMPDKPRYACFSGTSMILSAKVTGSVGLRGTDITVKEGGSIVDSEGKDAKPETQINSFQIPTVKTSFSEQKYKHAQHLSNVLNGGTYTLKGNYFVDGDFSIKDAVLAVPEHSSATIFVKGNAALAGNIGSNVTIIATEMVTLEGTGNNTERIMSIYAFKEIHVSQPIEGQVLLMSKGDIRINARIHGAVISQGNAFIDSPVEGSVLAEKMVVQSGSGEVKYDENIFRSLGLTRPQVVAWDF